jgi:phosphatidate cytidylyltransferase
VNWNTFLTRTLTAIVFAIIMLLGLLGQPLLFCALFLMVQFLALKEYFSLIQKINPAAAMPSVAQLMLQVLCAALLLFQSDLIAHSQYYIPVVLCVPALLLLTQSLRKQGALDAAIYGIGAIAYVSLPFCLLMHMRHISLLLPLGLIALIWINDTMAYIVGSFIGKTPFSEISPKKTWEGTIGGGLLTLLVAAIWGAYAPYYHTVDWVVLGLCAAIAGTLGDLFESKLKRLAGVKDSGSFMPGHGGALDRFDSLLFAVPFAFVYVYLFMEPLAIHVF